MRFSRRDGSVRIMTRAMLAPMLALLSGCAFVPAAKSPDSTLSGCRFYTPEWRLSFEKMKFEDDFCNATHEEAVLACLLVYGVVIPAGTFVVSGSVVLLGNTVHWLEYQGTCEDSLIQKKLGSFTKKTSALKPMTNPTIRQGEQRDQSRGFFG